MRSVQDAPGERYGLLFDNIEPTVGQVVLLFDEVRAASPNEAVKLGRLALRHAMRLGREVLTVEALAELGNAFRRQGDLRSAGRALLAARRMSLVAGMDPLAEARLHNLLASWRNQCRDHRRAVGHARRALRLYESIGQEWEALTSRVKLSFLLTEAGRAEHAVPVAEAAWHEALRLRNEPLALQALHNRIYALVESDRHDEALELLSAAAPTYRTVGTERLRVLATWLEARCHHGVGRAVRAAELLERVCVALARLELGYEYVIAGLHLGLAYHDAGMNRSTRRLCHELVPLAEALGVDDAALSALRLGLEAEQVSAATLQRVLAAVHRRPPISQPA